MARRVTVCADDYGLNAAVDEAILSLIDKKRIGGVGCLVETPRFAGAVAALRERETQVDVGLHLNFTDSYPGSPRIGTLPVLIAASFARAISAGDVTGRLRRQFSRFENAFKRMPAYVDSGDHVHQFPVVRDALMREIDIRYGSRKPLIRNTISSGPDAKLPVVTQLGAKALKQTLLQFAWPTNLDFVGAYRHDKKTNYAALATQWIKSVRDGAIWMCQPAVRAEELDPIGNYRVMEYEWLSSAAFDPDRLPASIEVVRPLGLLRQA